MNCSICYENFVNPEDFEPEEFRKMINSISLEKKIDRDYEKLSGYSIFKTIQKYKKVAK